MTTQPVVMVAVSGPAHQHPAIDWALTYAPSVNAAVELVHVVDMSWRATPASFAEEALLAAERELRALAAHYSTLSGSEVRATVLVGHPTRLLVEHAAAAELIVLGARGHNGYGMRQLNTVAVRVAAQVNVSTVVVPHSAPTGTGIVVGVDGSEFSVAPLAFAAREADRTGEPLIVVHSWRAPRPWSDDTVQGWPAEPEDEERRILSEAVAGIAQSYPDLKVHSEVVFGQATSTLYGASESARMLVVGSHGRHGFARAWLGSTSEELLLAMPTTVAVVR
ncbi:nucleotide-binding universal stress UspA family protein [Salinibacterium sp. CAN_S4]|uniref:universal stress protein n=1 Tax=Salinibacterium sp. CAN_S4 TaxID=2787727 RepID=UPI0018F0284E